MARRAFGSILTHKSNGSTYYIAVYHSPINSKRITKIFPYTAEGKTAAASYLDTVHLQIQAGAWQPPMQRKARNTVKHITFDTYWPGWVENRHKADGSRIKESSRSKYVSTITRHLSPYFGSVPLTDITAKDVQDWYDKQPISQDGRGTHSRYRSYRTLHAILESAATEPIDPQGDTIIPTNPCRLKLQRPKTHHTAVIAEISDLDKLAASLPAHLALTVHIAGIVGLRVGEVCALQRQDIDTINHIIHVRHSMMEVYKNGHRHIELSTPKTTTSIRDASYPESLNKQIELHLDTYVKPEPDAQVFTGQTGSLLAPQSLKNAWNKAKERTGITGIWFHDLRKTALTRMVEAGATVGEVMAQAGHASIDVASQYQKQSQSHHQKVMESLDTMITEHKSDKKHENPTGNNNTLIELLRSLPEKQQTEIIANLPAEKRIEVLSYLLA